MTSAPRDNFRESSPALALAGSGRGRLHPEVEVGRLLLRLGGLLVFGPASGTVRAARPAVDVSIRPAGFLPGPLASGAAAA